MLHILERAIIHIFAGTTVYLMAYIVLCWCIRKSVWTMRIVPALIAVGFIGWREPYDLANGQMLVKVYTDYASWVFSMALALFLLRRYEKEIKH